MKILIVGRILLAILIFILIYDLIDIFREIHRRGYISGAFSGVINDFASKYEERKKNRKVYQILEGEKEELNLIEKIDLMIERAGLKSYIPFITSEILMICTIVLALIIAILVQKFTGLIVFSIPVFFFVIFLMYLILKQLSKRIYDKIDDQVLIYINTLENLTSANSDIVEIIEKALPYIKEPLKTYSSQFVFECKKGLPIQKAFKNFENKIESHRFKQLLKNLEICSKYEANYKEILNKSRLIMKNYFIEKEKRKKEVRQCRIEILSVIIVGIIIFYIVVTGFNEELMMQLKNSFSGNLILGYNIVVLMVGLYKFITLDEINY